MRGNGARIRVPLLILLAVVLPGAPAAAARQTVLVLPFENSTGQEKYDPFREGLADLIAVQIGDVGELAAVERQLLDRIVAEQKLSLLGLTAPEERRRVARLVGANLVFSGGFMVQDQALVLQGHLFEVESARLVSADEVRGSIGELTGMAQALVGKLARQAKLQTQGTSQLAVDNSPLVNLHFIRGLGHHYAGQHDEAIMEFTHALRLDPRRADARFWLARSYHAAEEWAHAAVEWRRYLKDYPLHQQAREARALHDQAWEKLTDRERELLTGISGPAR